MWEVEGFHFVHIMASGRISLCESGTKVNLKTNRNKKFCK